MSNFDPVLRPKHYNVHPSGVECIDITAQMIHTIGNAYKYCFRRNEKNNRNEDLKKALFYINRELQAIRDPKMRTVLELNSKVIAKEPEPFDKILFCLAMADEGINGEYHLEQAKRLLEGEVDGH